MSPEEDPGRHAGEPRRTRKQLVRASINMARVLAIGDELAQINTVVIQSQIAYTNRNMHTGEEDWLLSDLYGRLSARRMALREELRKMG